jgi:hypothetical protein
MTPFAAEESFAGLYTETTRFAISAPLFPEICIRTQAFPRRYRR